MTEDLTKKQSILSSSSDLSGLGSLGMSYDKGSFSKERKSTNIIHKPRRTI